MDETSDGGSSGITGQEKEKIAEDRRTVAVGERIARLFYYTGRKVPAKTCQASSDLATKLKII